MASNRRLKLTFEFVVPDGTGKNVQDRHLERAVDMLESAVRTMATEAFPYASEVDVTREWNYAWWADTNYKHKTYPLPENEFNTPKSK